MRKAYLVRHGKKDKSQEVTVWKPRTPLAANGMTELHMVKHAYMTGRKWYAAYHSLGFERTRQTATMLATDVSPKPADELSPLTTVADADWLPMCVRDGRELLVTETLVEFPDMMRRIGSMGAMFVTDKVANAPTDANLMFVTHGPVVEAITATLLNQWPLIVPIAAFAEGDIVQLGFDDKMQVVQMKYLEAARAAKIVEKDIAPVERPFRPHPLDE